MVGRSRFVQRTAQAGCWLISVVHVLSSGKCHAAHAAIERRNSTVVQLSGVLISPAALQYRWRPLLDLGLQHCTATLALFYTTLNILVCIAGLKHLKSTRITESILQRRKINRRDSASHQSQNLALWMRPIKSQRTT